MRSALARSFPRPGSLRLLHSLRSHDKQPTLGGRSQYRRHSHQPGLRTSPTFKNRCRQHDSSRPLLAGSRTYSTTSIDHRFHLLTNCASLQDLLANSRDIFQDLQFEADVLGVKQHSLDLQERVRLVDQDQHRQDWTLWAELVQFRRRTDGDKGVAQIWERLSKTALPTEGPAADQLWAQFLQTANKNKDITVRKVIDKVVQLHKLDGRTSHLVYPAIMRHILRYRPQDAIAVFRAMKSAFKPPKDALECLIEDVQCSVSKNTAWRVFQEIYAVQQIHAVGAREVLYDHVMGILSRVNATAHDFYKWHTFLVNNRDLPSEAILADPLVQLFLERGRKQQDRNAVPQSREHIEHKKLLEQGNDILTRQGMSRHLGHVHGIEEKKLSDDLCARFFATKSFSLDFVLGSIYILGANTLGSLAVRELALRCDRPREYLESIRKAETRGLRISRSTFTEALRISANRNSLELFTFLVHGDFHPDQLDDDSHLAKLLGDVIESLSLETAFAIVKTITSISVQEHRATWNQLARACSLAADAIMLSRVLKHMVLQGTTFNPSNITLMKRNFLVERSAGRRPKTRSGRASFDQDAFVCNHLLFLLDNGQNLQPTVWTEMIKRYGMTGRLQALQRLVLRLAHFYGPRNPQHVFQRSTPGGSLEQAPSEEVSDSLRLFGQIEQGAIVAWGFLHERHGMPNVEYRRSRRASQSQKSRLFTFGLSILRKLEVAGIGMQLGVIRKEVIRNLFKLYGPGRSSRPYIRVLRRVNSYSLATRLAMIEKTWPGLMSPYEIDSQELSQSHRESANWYYRLFHDFMLDDRMARAYSAAQLETARRYKEAKLRQEVGDRSQPLGATLLQTVR